MSVFCPDVRRQSPCESGQGSWDTEEESDDKTTWKTTQNNLKQGEAQNYDNVYLYSPWQINTRMWNNPHATELQAVSIRLMMWHQVIVVENADLEDCGVDAHAHEQDADKAHHLWKKSKTNE